MGNKLAKLFLIIIYFLVAIFAISYISINNNPCNEKLTYSLGEIDPRFNLGKTEIINNLKISSSVWNKEAGKNIFSYQENNGKITINFIYDERQINTIKNNKIERKIEDEKEVLDTHKNNNSSLLADYELKKNNLLIQKENYEKELEKYNAEVLYWNNLGGANEEKYTELINKKNNLETNYSNINKEIENINKLVEEINVANEEQNKIANSINQKIDEINKDAGKEFEEGIYDLRTKTINIYEFESVKELQRVLAHEFGHALDIDHLASEESIMYYINTEKELALSEDDKKALKNICKK